MEKPWERVHNPSPLDGGENIRDTDSTVLEHWRWANSDLLSNAARGVLAEFLVAKAVGDPSPVRDPWGEYDVTMPGADGEPDIRVEVKSGAFLQSWHQRSFSKITFGRLKSRAWRSETNDVEKEPAYHADVYVFAVLACKDPDLIDPLDASQWEFRVLSRRTLEELGTASIGWSRVQTLAPDAVGWAGLRQAVRRVHG